MGDRGNVSYRGTGETTEWEDILVKKGILPPRETKEQNIEEDADEPAPGHPLENATLTEMDEFEDDFDDDAFLGKYREQRMAELKERTRTERFGEVREIVKADWIAEVNEASKTGFVVIHLYQNYIVECNVLDACLLSLAKKFKAVKFLKIIATAAVENWPDRNLPCLFVYRDGALAREIVGTSSMGGKQMRAEDLEWKLAEFGVVETELDADPREVRGGANALNLRRNFVASRGNDNE